MRGALLVVMLLASGCAHPCDARIYDACNELFHPMMTTDDLASPTEVRVQHVVEGASRALP